MTEHTPTPWKRGQQSNMRIYGPDGMGDHSGPVADTMHRMTSDEQRANVARIVACVNAFHSPDGRKIATEDIAEGLFWRIYDAVAALNHAAMAAQAETYLVPDDEIHRLLALFDSLNVQEPENG